MPTDFHAVVTVTAQTEDQAAQVLAERLSHDEDYSLVYTLAQPFGRASGKANATAMAYLLGLLPDREELSKVIAEALGRYTSEGSALDVADAVRARILQEAGRG